MYLNTIYKETKMIAALAVAILMIVTAAAAISSLESDAATERHEVKVITENVNGTNEAKYQVLDGKLVYTDADNLYVNVIQISNPEVPENPDPRYVYEFTGWYYETIGGELQEVTAEGIPVDRDLTVRGKVVETTRMFEVSVASNNTEYGTVEWYNSDNSPVGESTIKASYGSEIYAEKNHLYVNDRVADVSFYAIATPTEGIVDDFFFAFESWDLGDVSQISSALTVTATFEERSTIIEYNGVVYKIQDLSGIVTAIGYNPAVESIVIPDTFYYDDYDMTCTPTAVAAEAFLGCTIVDFVEIGANVAEIGSRAFAADSFKSITVSGDNENYASKDGVLYNKDFTTLIQFPCSMRMLYIPDTVTTIAEGAFQNAGAYLKAQSGSQDPAYFRYVKFPASVTTIGADAFSGSTLECLKFSGSEQVIIGDYAFACDSLNYIVFNAQFVEVASNAFYGCVFYDETGQSMPVEAAINGYKFTSEAGSAELNIYVPPLKGTFANSGVKYRITSNDVESKTVAAACFAKDEVADLVIPESITYLGFEWAVTSIASQAFAGTGITSVTTSANIGSNAFKGCKSLTTVTLNGGTTIGSYAFFGCKALETVDLGDVTSIGTSAFSGCSSLSTIDLSGVVSIGKHAFYCCSELTSADLSSAVTIGYGAFSGTNLGYVAFGGALENVDSKAFFGYTFKDVDGGKIKVVAGELKERIFSGENKILTEQ